MAWPCDQTDGYWRERNSRSPGEGNQLRCNFHNSTMWLLAFVLEQKTRGATRFETDLSRRGLIRIATYPMGSLKKAHFYAVLLLFLTICFAPKLQFCLKGSCWCCAAVHTPPINYRCLFVVASPAAGYCL